MPKFYFHLRDGTDQLLDPDGLEFSDADQIAETALEAARCCIAGDVRNGVVDLRYRIEVEDAAGKIVHALPFEDAVRIEKV
jgi:hypothetical protein